MNWSVELAPLKRTSLILTGSAFRSLWAVVSNCVPLRAGSLHSALAFRKPAADAGGEVTLNVALTLPPGATGSPSVFDAVPPPETAAVHLVGRERLKLTPATGDPVVFVNVAVASRMDPGVNVVTRERLSRCTSYLAATMLACTASVVASGGYPAVITPS